MSGNDTAAADVSGLVERLSRSIDQWRKMVPVAVTAGSPAQIEYALADAKHDIIALWATIQTLSASNAALEAENARLREALAFYADIGKYPAPVTGRYGELYYDCGAIARAALSSPKGGRDHG